MCLFLLLETSWHTNECKQDQIDNETEHIPENEVFFVAVIGVITWRDLKNNGITAGIHHIGISSEYVTSPTIEHMSMAIEQNDWPTANEWAKIIENEIKTEKGNRYDKASVYGFRKRFNTILKLDRNINSNIVEKLMAHKNGLDGAYLKPTRDECFEEFVKAIPKLTISDESRDKLKIEKLQKEKTEIEELRLEVQGFRNMVNTIDKRILFESDMVTGLVPFELPDIPRYSKLRLQQQIKKDPATYSHLRHLLS